MTDRKKAGEVMEVASEHIDNIDNINSIIESGYNKRVHVETNEAKSYSSCILVFNGGVLFVGVNLMDLKEAVVTGYTLDEETYIDNKPININSSALKFSSKEGIKAHDALYKKLK